MNAIWSVAFRTVALAAALGMATASAFATEVSDSVPSPTPIQVKIVKDGKVQWIWDAMVYQVGSTPSLVAVTDETSSTYVDSCVNTIRPKQGTETVCTPGAIKSGVNGQLLMLPSDVLHVKLDYVELLSIREVHADSAIVEAPTRHVAGVQQDIRLPAGGSVTLGSGDIKFLISRGKPGTTLTPVQSVGSTGPVDDSWIRINGNEGISCSSGHLIVARGTGGGTLLTCSGHALKPTGQADHFHASEFAQLTGFASDDDSCETNGLVATSRDGTGTWLTCTDHVFKPIGQAGGAPGRKTASVSQ